MSRTAINRQQEGLAIANIDGALKRINETKYAVKSQNGNGGYDVCSTDLAGLILDDGPGGYSIIVVKGVFYNTFFRRKL